MDEHVDVDANDRVGSLYNFLRKEVGRFFCSAATAPLSDFRGVIGGGSFTPEIYEECRVLNRYYAGRVVEIMTHRQQLLKELEKANAEIDASQHDAEALKKLFFRRNQALAALNAHEKRAGDELKALVSELQKWSSSKNGTRLSYLSALHAIVCRGQTGEPECGDRDGINRVLQLSAGSRESDCGTYRWPSGHRGNSQSVRRRSGNRRGRADLLGSTLHAT
jgi:hypothetical protein